jgi:YteA family regulatory protein
MNALHDREWIELKQCLEAELAELEQNETVPLESTGELSGYDNHPADSATELYENEKDLALNEQAARRMQDIRNALERMENGTYGICSVCRQPIPIERLRALPTAERCANHADDRYVPDTRPLEEAVLQPPFGQTSMDDTSQTAFDGEDSWQTVESWGTSDTPALAEEPDIQDYNAMYIEADEADGYVEPLESFLTADLYGDPIGIVRNREYRKYLERGEGDHMLETKTFKL